MVRIGGAPPHAGTVADETHEASVHDVPTQGSGMSHEVSPASIGRGPTLQDLISHSRRMPTGDQLAAQRAKLKMVRALDAGPLDATREAVRRPQWREDNPSTGLPRVAVEPAHEFVDAVTSIRREIADVKASLDEQSIGSGHVDTFARESLNEWAGRTHRAVSGLKHPGAYLSGAKRKIYVNWRTNAPETTPAQRDSDARAGFSALKKLDRGFNGVDVKSQNRGNLHPARYQRTHGKEAALNEFAYHALPKNPRAVVGEKPFARLTVNFDPDAVPAAASRIGKIVRDRPGDVGQAKIMGPARTGGRVDDAVIYMHIADPAAAREIDAKLRKDIAPPQRPSTAPGMEPLSHISAYAEYALGAQGSHELDRGDIIKKAVMGKLDGGQRPLTEFVRDEVVAAGYDPDRPSHLAKRPDAPEARPKRGGIGGLVGRLFGRK